MIYYIYNFNLNDPINSIPDKAKNIILNGSIEKFEIPSKSLGITRTYKIDFEGIKNYIKKAYDEAATTSIKRWAGDFMDSCICEICLGSRLKRESLNFKISRFTISDLVKMDLNNLYDYFYLHYLYLMF